jgi:hypothetical protein
VNTNLYKIVGPRILILPNDQAAIHLQKVKMENKGHIYGEIALLLPDCKMQYEKKRETVRVDQTKFL